MAFSGGEPLLHPDLDFLLRHICSRGMMAGLITKRYRLSPNRILARTRPASTSSRSASTTSSPTRCRRRASALLDKKLEWARDYATFDININSVLGGGIKNPEDARTINRRARQARLLDVDRHD